MPNMQQKHISDMLEAIGDLSKVYTIQTWMDQLLYNDRSGIFTFPVIEMDSLSKNFKMIL